MITLAEKIELLQAEERGEVIMVCSGGQIGPKQKGKWDFENGFFAVVKPKPKLVPMWQMLVKDNNGMRVIPFLYPSEQKAREAAGPDFIQLVEPPIMVKQS